MRSETPRVLHLLIYFSSKMALIGGSCILIVYFSIWKFASGVPLPCEVMEQTANCTLKQLISIPRQLPENITELLMSENLLNQTEAFAFRRYHSLVYLDLSKNKIIKLENFSFTGLNELRVLNLEHNSLNLTTAVYPSLCFEGLKSLQKLFIGNNVGLDWFLNPTSKFTYPDEAISLLISLEELTIDGLPGSVFGQGFNLLSKFQRLEFKQCYLNFIQPTMFLHTPHITWLGMSKCHIYDSDDSSFENLGRIDSLDLSFNPDLGFDNLTNILHGLQNSAIRVLNVSGISPRFGVCIVPPVDFLKFLYNTSLEEIICNANSILMFKPGTLNHFPPSVKYLSIKYNIFTFGQYIFDIIKLTGVKRADLSDNNVGHIAVHPDGDDIPVFPDYLPTFPLPPNLEDLTVRNMITNAGIPPVKFMKNQLRSLDISRNGIPVGKGPVYGRESLTRLDLSNNYCKKVFPSFFSEFPHLRFLNVSNNLLGDSLKDTSTRLLFENLTKLEILDLSNNRLRVLQKSLFTNTKMLKVLNISNNQLDLYQVDLSHLSLQFLNLRINELRTIPKHARHNLDTMTGKQLLLINLSQNPLLCTCENIDFLLWIKDTKVSLQSRGTYQCIDESSQMKLMDSSLIMDKIQHCKSYAGLAFGGGCALIFFLSLSAAGLIYRYRWRLKYLYYVARGRCQPAGQNPNHEERHFTYDAFISYANEDMDFVDGLITTLEGHGRCLCVHHRDFKLGEPIGSNIVSAIQNSRHTVILLSPNFLGSNWCRYEFEMARLESVYESRNVVLLVKIEDVPPADLPRELMFMMQSDSYLEFPNDEYVQAAFWLNLNEAIIRN